MGAYRAILEPGDKVLGMALDQGGHLTHGHPLSFSGIDYEFHPYYVNKETEMIDYDELERLAVEIKPKLIVAGASAYPRIIDFKRFKEICDKVGALFMVDMAHIAGLVAAKLHPNPCIGWSPSALDRRSRHRFCIADTSMASGPMGSWFAWIWTAMNDGPGPVRTNSAWGPISLSDRSCMS